MESLKLAGETTMITLTFIAIDIITGYLGAWSQKKISTSKMREGLAHKCALILIMVMAKLIDFTQSENIINLGIQVPMFEIACIYIITMEINSIIENIGIIFPQLKDSILLSAFTNNAAYMQKMTSPKPQPQHSTQNKTSDTQGITPPPEIPSNLLKEN